MKKGKNQTIFRRNNDRCRFCRWSSTSLKYTSLSRIPTALPRASSRYIGLNVNENKTEFMCFKKKTSTFSEPVHILRQQYLIYWKWCQHTSSEGVEWYRQVIDHIKVWSMRSNIFFWAVAVSLLPYGCTTWTPRKYLEKKLDGNCTRMLRAILNNSWKQ